MEELEEAHKDYEERKNEIITKLSKLIDCRALLTDEREWIKEAIEFIMEKEI